MHAQRLRIILQGRRCCQADFADAWGGILEWAGRPTTNGFEGMKTSEAASFQVL